MPDLTIRHARPEDKAAVMEISATVWDGNDYLPHVWDAWLTESSEDGFLLAAEVGGKVVGIQHTDIQNGGIAWMEGIRVHPDYRKQGIAARMLERAIEKSEELDLSIVRLSTADVNDASAKLAVSHGLREVGQFYIFSADSLTGESVHVAPTRLTDENVEVLQRKMGRGDKFIVHQWSAFELPGQKSTADFDHHLKYDVHGEPAAIGLASSSRDGTELSVAYIDGTEEGIRILAHDFRTLAGSLALSSVGAMLPDRDQTFAILKDEGYMFHDDMHVLIFEGPLVKRQDA